MRNIELILSLLFFCNASFGQAASYTDPAIAYQRVMIEKGQEGTYQQIGNFKVTGTSYLFGERLKGGVYTQTEKSDNVKIGFNTYTQSLDVYIDDTRSLSKQSTEVDSFTIYGGQSDFLKNNLLFYSGRLINPSAKGFFQVLQTGKNFNLYKSYNSTLDIVSTNYIQSDLRQFSMEYNYWYLDVKSNQFKKLRASRKKIIDEFKSVTDLSPFTDNDELNSNPEASLRKIFNVLNNL
jgi:hypothetical protein